MPDLISDQKPIGAFEAFRRLFADRTHQEIPPDVHPPEDPAQLAAFVERYFGLSVPMRPMCPHHNSPLDYLAASFFDQADLLVWANRGGGKTLLAAVATILDALFRAPTRIRILGGSFDQSDRLAEYIRTFLSAQEQLIVGNPTKQRVELVGGSDIQMLAQSQRAVRGQHVQKIRCDEVDLFDGEVWRAVQFSTRSQRNARGSIEVLSTLHRPGVLMQKLVEDVNAASAGGGGYRLIRWCIWDVIERCEESRSCDGCPLAEDCKGAAKKASGFYRIDDAIAIKARSSRAAWEGEMLCTGAHREFAVFAEFDLSRHVQGVEFNPEFPTYRAIDFGYRNPLVCLWIQLTPGGRVHVVDEYVRTRLPIAQHAAEILKRDRGSVVMTYVDPAGTQRESTSGAACTELLAAAGIPCAWRGSAISEGIELVRTALAPATGEPTLAIHPRCVKLIEAFQNYHY
ncbi:MAG: hypothetical protein ACYSTL_03905, partial [Planctomycetota bacterium]